jgi:hypothetical protein
MGASSRMVTAAMRQSHAPVLHQGCLASQLLIVTAVPTEDQRPPRFASGERETVMRLWDYHRQSFLRKVTGVSDADATRRLVGSETTLLWLANHMATTQRGWILNAFAGGSESPPAPVPESMALSMPAVRPGDRSTG